jgi:replication factor A1
MLKIPLADIIAKIKEKTDLSDADINAKIDDKLKQLSGLISKEGAAHIIANELGVKIFEQVSGKLQIKNILAGMRSVETVGKVTRVFELREFKTENREGQVSSMFIGDETGTIRITMWGDQAGNIRRIKEGDIVKIVGGYVRENQGRKEVHLNDRSKLIINPEGEKIDKVAEFSQPAATRKTINELAPEDQNVEILGTIVQAFEPKFFEVCPECGKRAKPEGENFICPEHSAVTPDYSYVMNVVLDDGTETVRCAFFRNQTERLISKTKDELMKYKEAPEDFEQVKTDLLGNQVKLVGRVNKNEMFDRLEFVAQLVFTNPNPEEEIKRLENS